MADIFVDPDATGANNGGSWTDAYTSLNTALQTGGAPKVTAGDIVLCKGTVEEEVVVAVGGTLGANIVVRGDTGSGTGASPSPATFTIDGVSSSTDCLTTTLGGAFHYTFIDIRCTGSNNDGFDFPAGDNILFINCQADNNDVIGFYCDNYCKFINCTAFSNGGVNIRADLGIFVYGCLCYSGSSHGIQIRDGVVLNTLSYKNNGRNVYFVAHANRIAAAVNCTVDGDKDNAAITASSVGVYFTTDDALACVINCLLHDCDYGINGNTGTADQRLNYYNLFSNTMGADLLDYEASRGGQVDAVPGFVDEGNTDYRLASGSAAKAAGVDAGLLVS